jgi:beta-N-acetylhexosaminidase
MRLIIIFLFSAILLSAASLKKEIAGMLIVGFCGKSLDQNSTLVHTIQKYSLGGVILFTPNLFDREQVQKLTSALQGLHQKKLFIALDQEGGFVDRLGKIEGSFKTPSAARMSRFKEERVKRYYRKMAKEMKSLGFNLNFAPVVDLAVNPENRVIVGFQRAYGDSPRKVVQMASWFIDAMHQEGILTTLKHFPGHGSSTGDSHEGFTDVSNSWHKEELLPFMKLIALHKADMIMTAHIFNRHLDTIYPATLSRHVVNDLLRQSMGYNGVVVSDDLQMGAIRKNYDLKESITRAINAGVDLLLFGNQIGKPYDIEMLIALIASLVEEGRVSRERILEANERIDRLKAKF